MNIAKCYQQLQMHQNTSYIKCLQSRYLFTIIQIDYQLWSIENQYYIDSNIIELAWCKSTLVNTASLCLVSSDPQNSIITKMNKYKNSVRYKFSWKKQNGSCQSYCGVTLIWHIMCILNAVALLCSTLVNAQSYKPVSFHNTLKLWTFHTATAIS